MSGLCTRGLRAGGTLSSTSSGCHPQQLFSRCCVPREASFPTPSHPPFAIAFFCQCADGGARPPIVVCLCGGGGGATRALASADHAGVPRADWWVPAGKDTSAVWPLRHGAVGICLAPHRVARHCRRVVTCASHALLQAMLTNRRAKWVAAEVRWMTIAGLSRGRPRPIQYHELQDAWSTPCAV